MVPTILKCFLIIVIVLCCESASNPVKEADIMKLYNSYQKAVKDMVSHLKTHSYRRVSVNDAEYEVHVNKLKDVNGFKMHNILVKRLDPNTNTTIYITNPLESKLPHPFMSLEEFKNALVQQQIKDREVFEKSKLRSGNVKSRTGIKKTTSKLKFTRTAKLAKNIHNVLRTTVKKVRAKASTISTKPKTKKESKHAQKATLSKVSQQTRTKTREGKKLTAKKRTLVKNLSSSPVNMKRNITLTTLKSLTTYFRVKLVGSDQTAPTKHISKKRSKNESLRAKLNQTVNKILTKNAKTSKIRSKHNTMESTVTTIKLSELYQTINKALTQNHKTTETRLKDNTMETTEATNVTTIKLAEVDQTVNKTSIQNDKTYEIQTDDNTRETTEATTTKLSEQESTTVSVEKLDIIDDKIATLEDNSNKDKTTAVDEKELIITSTDVSTSPESELTTLDEEKLATDEERTTDTEEEIATSEETSEENTAKTTKVTKTTKSRIKWSKPRVFMGGEQPEVESPPET